MNFLALIAQAGEQAVEILNNDWRIQSEVIVLRVLSIVVWGFVLWRIFKLQSPLPYEGHSQVPWNGLDVLVVALSTFVIWEILPVVLLNVQGFKTLDEKALHSVAGIWAQVVARLVSFFVAIVLLRVRSHANASSMGFTLIFFERDILAGLLAFVFIVPPVLTVQGILTHYWSYKQPLISKVFEDPTILPLIALLAVVVAPLLEEFLLRVVLQGWLERAERSRLPQDRWLRQAPTGTVPILCSSALFALLHSGQGPAPIPLFFFGLVLGYLYHQTHRIWPSLVVHVGLNGLTVINLWITGDA